MESILIVIIIILIVMLNNKKNADSKQATISINNNIPTPIEPQSKPSLIVIADDLAKALLEEKLRETYTQYSHFEKWEKNGFILSPYQRVRVHLTNKGYEDIEVGFNLNENKIPLYVELKIPPLRIDTECTGIEASTNTTKDA